jgi:hypothetical protein
MELPDQFDGCQRTKFGTNCPNLIDSLSEDLFKKNFPNVDGMERQSGKSHKTVVGRIYYSV